MSDDLRRRMFDKNMALIVDASGPNTVEQYWEQDWHELNVNLDILEKSNALDAIRYYTEYAESAAKLGAA